MEGAFGAGGEFQSTHPSGVRLYLRVCEDHTRQDFNPRTPVGCDVPSAVVSGILDEISIHAPQWGATGQPAPPWAGYRNFNPRTPVGCDAHAPPTPPNPANFNPRTPVGCDRTSGCLWCSTGDFNPRTPVGCDTSPSASAGTSLVFQSTHPSGVRRSSGSDGLGWRSNFNPRTPVGCDGDGNVHYGYRHISIHAPQWGATHGAQRASGRPDISIHAPQWGATMTQMPFSLELPIFQSTHPSGVRLICAVSCGLRTEISIHAPQWGATRDGAIGLAVTDISIHAPQWGATS